MKTSLSKRLLHNRYIYAVVAGLIHALAFPQFNLAGFAWVAPALILGSSARRIGGKAWRIGYVAGFVQWLISLSWLLNIPVTGFPILGWVALSAFLAIYTATWVWLLSGRVSHGSWMRRCAWSLGGAAAWVGLEMIRARFLSGFPWDNIGASQWQNLPLIQIASATGVYGVSFIVVWSSLSLYSGALAIFRNPTTRYIWLGEIILPLIVVLSVFSAGMSRVRHAPAENHMLRATFIQPAIPQTTIWDQNENTNRFNGLIALTQTSLTNKTDLLLWPEAGLPELNDYTFSVITNLALSYNISMIFNADEVRLREHATSEDDYDVFNSAFALNPRGELRGIYRKRHLVMFGEYVPLANTLPFMKRLTTITGSFTPGDRINRFPLGNFVAAPLICFEDTFAHHVRDHVDDETDFLVNLTNNGWFGRGAAQWQHLASAAFRAVENGVPLLRCCNDGITCWFDARGNMRQIFKSASGSEFDAGFANWEISFASAKTRGPATFYNQHGDWFGWSCVGVTAFLLTIRLAKRKAKPSAN